jgi:integrase/recombinase XerD
MVFMSELPALSRKNTHLAWIRLEAFLSTRAPNTQITYRGILREWCEFLGAIPETESGTKKILAATDLHALSYRKWLFSRPGQRARMASSSSSHSKRTKALSAEVNRKDREKKSGLEQTQTNATVWKKLAALRRLYRVLVAAELISGNPFDTDKVAPPPKDSGRKRPTEMVPFELVREILSLPDTSTEKGLRDKALLSILFGAGLRRSEAASIRIGDLKKSSGGTSYVLLRATKAKKDQQAALPDWVSAVLFAYVAIRKQDHKAKDGDFLFCAYVGQAGKTAVNRPISHSGIYKLFKEYALRAGVSAVVSPHSARATAITKLLDDGLSHRFVQEFSRHASIQMVEVYDKRRIGIDSSPAKNLKF